MVIVLLGYNKTKYKNKLDKVIQADHKQKGQDAASKKNKHGNEISQVQLLAKLDSIKKR